MALSCVLAGTLGGCATQPPYGGGRSTDELEFLDRALSGSPSMREALWHETLAGGARGQEAQLRLALLQSVPEHSGFDPAAAQRNLRALLAQGPPQDLAAVARVRLDELKAASQCVGETQALRRRLAQVVNIERDLDNRGN
jgi:hypothetical protein